MGKHSRDRRISIPEAFLATDAILSLYINVVQGGTVYPKVAEKHLKEELPFMTTENILMYCVEKGGDRQLLHEAIRKHSVATAKEVKLEGKENDVIARIVADPLFSLTKEEVEKVLAENSFIGCAEQQTEDFLKNVVLPVLNANSECSGEKVNIEV